MRSKINIAESLELSTWSAEELKRSIQSSQIRKVKNLCRLFALVITLTYIAIFFGGGLLLKEHQIISEPALLQNIFATVLFVVLFIPIYFLIIDSTVSASAKLRIMPKRYARMTIKNWNTNVFELSAALGAGIGAGM